GGRMYNSRFDRQNRHSMNTPRRGTRDEPWRDRESFRNDNDFDRFSRGYYPSRDDINSQSRYGSRRYQQGRYDREREQQYPYEEQRQYGYSHTSTGIGENYVSDRGIDDGRIEFDRNRSTYAPLYSQEEGQRLSSYGSNYEPSSWTQEYRNRENEGGLWQSVKNFFGKGPKGYRRSSERIKEDVSEALYRHPEIDASEIEVSVQGGEVVLK